MNGHFHAFQKYVDIFVISVMYYKVNFTKDKEISIFWIFKNTFIR